jgi:hypothetical protein
VDVFLRREKDMKKILLIAMFVLSLFIMSGCGGGHERHGHHDRGTNIEVEVHH